MACRSCQKSFDLVPRFLPLRQGVRSLRDSHDASPSSAASLSRRTSAGSPSIAPIHNTRRQLHTSRANREGPVKGVLQKLAGTGMAQSYLIYGASEKLYKACSAQATYSITEEDRKEGRVTLGPDGEDVGTGGGLWHNEFKLLPTFSTWSQVTMLHLYLLIVRFRCLDKELYQNWQAQLVDHFFHEAEEKMDLFHGMTSRSIRQRNLQDLFQQWRGLILAYDEGLVKGDAVLASAVWRNLFKAKDDVDLRVLAAIVSWMRLCLKNLDNFHDEQLPLYSASVFKLPVTSELSVVDQPAKGLAGAI